jgi:zinc transporter, ZIP family
MNESISVSMNYAALPIVALVVSGLFALNRQVSKPRLSMFQHFAAGVVIASVALELLPVLLKAGSVPGMTLGYIAGVAVMLIIERLAARTGAKVPIAIDLFIDGLLLMIGFSTGEKGGFLLLLGLTLETTALGIVLAPSLAAGGKTRTQVIVPLMGFGLSILAGAGCGLFLPRETGFWFAAILGFGVAALLYLVVEELIAEAHETKDTAFTTALFFAGFLIPLLLGQVGP